MQKKQIPILFSTPMVQAILDGRKTETRREVKPQPIDNREIDGNFFEGNHKGYVKVDGHANWQAQFANEFAKWQPGDVLWVRETIIAHPAYSAKDYKAGLCGPLFDEDGSAVAFRGYVADGLDEMERKIWRQIPSIHMPKAAARIWLEVLEVKVERLQDITEDSVRAEGVQIPVAPSDVPGMVKPLWRLGMVRGAMHFMPDGWETLPEEEKSRLIYYANFAELWCEINGLESWQSNPWVWVIKFKVLSTTGKPQGI